MEKSLKTNISNQTGTDILGQEKIGRLLRMYAIPSIISMLVNALYNIVDQIFIGQGIGYLGTGATNIIFPLTIAFASFALMLGDGASAYLSLKLGEGQKEKAARGVGNGILVSVIISISFATVVLVFFPQFLNLFGCTAELEPYAKDYGYIVAVGFPFFAICATINSIIRADGSPGFAMGSMLVGSVLNIILDPIFMFVFGLGIKGAALATVVSQITSFTLNVLRLRKLKSIKLKGNFKLNISVIAKIITLGASSFITQVFATIVMGIQNNLLKTYGALSVYGSEIPISVIGVIFKAVEILNSIVLGLAVGSQPIIGYNYGAKNFDRVKKTLKTVMFFVIGKYFRLRRYSPDYKGCTVFLCSYASCCFVCVSERKLISPTKLKIISTFCTRFPSTFSGAWTMIFLINSLTIVGVSSFIPTYLRIITEKLSKSLLFCS